jgi:hypothetical protein
VLKLAKCYARAAELFVLRQYAGLKDGMYRLLEAIEGLRNIGFGRVMLSLIWGGPGWAILT